MADTLFSLNSIGRALQNIIQSIPVIRTGGYVTLPTSSQNREASLAGILASVYKLFNPTQEQPMKITPSGEVITKSGSAEAATYQPTGSAGSFLGNISLYPYQGFSSILTPTYVPTPKTKVSTSTTSKTTPTPTPTPAPTQKATITTPASAPTPAPTPPQPDVFPTVRVRGLTSYRSPTIKYSAPVPSALPPTPVAPGEITQPTTPENLARFEAMIRALQTLAGGLLRIFLIKS